MWLCRSVLAFAKNVRFRCRRAGEARHIRHRRILFRRSQRFCDRIDDIILYAGVGVGCLVCQLWQSNRRGVRVLWPVIYELKVKLFMMRCGRKIDIVVVVTKVIYTTKCILWGAGGGSDRQWYGNTHTLTTKANHKIHFRMPLACRASRTNNNDGWSMCRE